MKDSVVMQIASIAAVLFLALVIVSYAGTGTSSTTSSGTTLSCSETDGGDNIFVKGTNTGVSENGKYTKTDTCFNSTVIEEHLCNSTKLTAIRRPCPGGYECSAGSCISVVTCVDRDGGADDIYNRSQLDLYYRSDGRLYRSYNDTCAGSGVREYRCSTSPERLFEERVIPCPSDVCSLSLGVCTRRS